MATKAPKAPASAAVASIAPMMVGTLNLFVIEMMGEPCGITDMEAKFLIPSVQRTLERLPARAAEQAAIVLDPLIIVGVMGMWFRRATAIKREEARQAYIVSPLEAARANGVSGTEYRVPDVQSDFMSNHQPTTAQIANEQAFYDELRRQDEMRAAGLVVIPPDTKGVPIPDHPDMTSGGVPPVIREAFNGSL